MSMMKLTSVMIVDDVQLESKVWHSLGFKTVVEVPHGDATGFAILAAGDCEVMLQTLPSLQEDLPAVAKTLGVKTSYVFAEVADLAKVKSELKGAEIIVPERETPYGMREIFVRTSSGEVLGFAQKK